MLVAVFRFCYISNTILSSMCSLHQFRPIWRSRPIATFLRTWRPFFPVAPFTIYYIDRLFFKKASYTLEIDPIALWILLSVHFFTSHLPIRYYLGIVISCMARFSFPFQGNALPQEDLLTFSGEMFCCPSHMALNNGNPHSSMKRFQILVPAILFSQEPNQTIHNSLRIHNDNQ